MPWSHALTGHRDRDTRPRCLALLSLDVHDLRALGRGAGRTAARPTGSALSGGVDLGPERQLEGLRRGLGMAVGGRTGRSASRPSSRVAPGVSPALARVDVAQPELGEHPHARVAARPGRSIRPGTGPAGRGDNGAVGSGGLRLVAVLGQVQRQRRRRCARAAAQLVEQAARAGRCRPAGRRPGRGRSRSGAARRASRGGARSRRPQRARSPGTRARLSGSSWSSTQASVAQEAQRRHAAVAGARGVGRVGAVLPSSTWLAGLTRLIAA